MNVRATALARWDTAHQPTRLRAEPAGPAGYDIVEKVFEEVAQDYLGFAWRHQPFARLRDKVGLADIWMLWNNDRVVGYALVDVDKTVLKITDLLLKSGVDAAEAVAAVASVLKTAYVWVKLSRPEEIASLRRAGYQVAHRLGRLHAEAAGARGYGGGCTPPAGHRYGPVPDLVAGYDIMVCLYGVWAAAPPTHHKVSKKELDSG